MRYIYGGDGELAIDLSGMHGCRNAFLHFHIIGKNAERTRDPALFKECWNYSGYGGTRTLTSKEPYEVDEFLNDWLLFEQPGSYVVIARSSQAALTHPGYSWVRDNLPAVESAPLRIEIVRPDSKRRTLEIAAAAAKLKDSSEKVRKDGVARLRFMNDARAIPFMITALADADRVVGLEARRGLWDSPHTQVVRRELTNAMLDRKHLIGPTVASAYFVALLGVGDLRLKGLNLDDFAREVRAKRVREIPDFERWKKAFSKIYIDRLPTLTPKEQVNLAAEGLYHEFLQCKDSPHCSTIIRHADLIDAKTSMTAANALGRCCKRADLAQDFISLAKQQTVSGEIRSAALGILLSTAPQSIDDTVRDSIVKEIVSPTPRFWIWNVEQVIGDYKSDEIGRGLLANFTTAKDREVRSEASRRIRSYGGAIPTADLIRAFESLKSTVTMEGYYMQHPLLESIAIKSPHDAIRLIRDVFRSRNPYRDHSGAIAVLARLEPELSKDLIIDIFNSGSRNDRASLLRYQAEAFEEVRRMVRVQNRHLSPSRTAVGYFTPELIKTYESDKELRWQALCVLQKLTGIPAGRNANMFGFAPLFDARSHKNPSIDDSRRWPDIWKAWWKQNRSKFGR